jgi:D-lactate dehydratase
MPGTLPSKALIYISSFNGPIYPNGQKTGLFFTKALHPFEVLSQAGFAMNIASETGTYGLDEISLTDPS